MKKRILPLLLALALLCTLLPQLGLFAAAVDSGTCGSGVSWTLSETGSGTYELTISGSGPMDDYNYNNYAPWNSYRSSIERVTIQRGVMTIGALAFYCCGRLTSVSIPDSVTNIGKQAFSDCTSLTSVSIPDSVINIGYYAFYGCTSLTSVSIPDSVISIGDSAFSDCTSLTSVSIPDSVTSIGISAFYGCTSLMSVTIPDSVTSIGGGAFHGCTSLTSVTIPDSVTEISYGLFYGCTSLKQVKLPGSLTEIGSQAFAGCKSLSSLVIPGKVHYIYSKAFSNCTSLTSIALPKELYHLGDYAFENCTSLISVILKAPAFEGQCLEIGEFAFINCTGLARVVLPTSVYKLGAGVFHRCTSLSSVTVYGESCEYPNYKSTLGDPANTLVRGLKNSTTEAFAKKYGYRFEAFNPKTEPYQSDTFKDVSDSDWFAAAVLWAVSQNPPITNGVDSTHFAPNKNCSRAEIVTFLWNAAGKPELNSSASGSNLSDSNPFVDVKTSDWFYNAVMWAVANGITNGVDANHFGPTKMCSRAEVVTFLWNAAKQLTQSTHASTSDLSAGESPFVDIKESDWYYQAVLWAVGEGITSGVDATHFAPAKVCTRAEVVQFLYKAS